MHSSIVVYDVFILEDLLKGIIQCVVAYEILYANCHISFKM